MTEITAIKVKNFRVFKDLHTFSLKPITLLTGPNNSGKSSLIKLINLLKISAQSDDGLDSLDFDIFSDFGGYASALNDPERDLIFGIVKKYSGKINLELNLKYGKFSKDFRLNPNKLYLKGIFVSYRKQNLFTLDFVKRNNKEVPKGDANYGFLKLFEETFEYSINKDLLKDVFFKFKESADEDKELYKELESKSIFNDALINEYKFISLLEEFNDVIDSINSEGFISREVEKWKSYEPDSAFSFLSFLKYLAKEKSSKKLPTSPLEGSRGFSALIQNIVLNSIDSFSSVYLKNYYHSSVASRKVDTRGISYNDPYLGLLIKEYLNFNEDFKNSVVNKVKTWLIKTAIGFDSFMIDNKAAFHLCVIYLGNKDSKENVKWRHLHDLGFGITQLIAILLRLAISEVKQLDSFTHERIPSTIAIEEPETNLHPNLQSKLVDLIVHAANNFQMNFIIETHSPFIVRRLQFHRVLNEEVSEKDICIYYFSLIDENKTSVKSIKITDNGLLDPNFGEGFLDEETEQKIALMRLKTKNLN
jgi:predicted ATPase